MPFNTTNSFATNIKTAATTLGKAASTVAGAGAGAFNKVAGFASALRSGSLPGGGEVANQSRTVKASFTGASERDWRVKLSLPRDDTYSKSPILQPLKEAGAVIFPYTPQINISHQASYQALEPVHNNYPFVAYENSKIDRITITGDFYVENSVESAYWIAVVHYLRSVTKMYFGNTTENAGAPPPIVYLKGYGDFVFNNVPVVVTNFTVDMPKDVDYIPSKFLGQTEVFTDFDSGFVEKEGVGYAPSRSSLMVTLQPAYTREQVRKFNLNDFVNGAYVFDKGLV
jgi:hypothetical protein